MAFYHLVCHTIPGGQKTSKLHKFSRRATFSGCVTLSRETEPKLQPCWNVKVVFMLTEIEWGMYAGNFGPRWVGGVGQLIHDVAMHWFVIDTSRWRLQVYTGSSPRGGGRVFGVADPSPWCRSLTMRDGCCAQACVRSSGDACVHQWGTPRSEVGVFTARISRSPPLPTQPWADHLVCSNRQLQSPKETDRISAACASSGVLSTPAGKNEEAIWFPQHSARIFHPRVYVEFHMPRIF